MRRGDLGMELTLGRENARETREKTLQARISWVEVSPQLCSYCFVLSAYRGHFTFFS